MGNSRYSVWVLYLVIAFGMLLSDGWIYTMAAWVLAIVLLAHLVEFFMKRDVMEKAGGSMGYHFVQTMIYGLFHWKPLEEQQKEDA
ncbi:MAG: hypothetical protein VX252_03060 [Myxococcota bacterium]|nr:hypothetical protein [Myxococcota bacterium]